MGIVFMDPTVVMSVIGLFAAALGGLAMFLVSSSTRRVAALEAAFAKFKEKVADEYVKAGTVTDLEHRLMDTINRMDKKLDRLLGIQGD